MVAQKRLLYLCDPDKNTDCPKTYCAYLHPGFGECCRTSDIRFAKTGEDGKPVEILNVDEQ